MSITRAVKGSPVYPEGSLKDRLELGWGNLGGGRGQGRGSRPVEGLRWSLEEVGVAQHGG